MCRVVSMNQLLEFFILLLCKFNQRLRSFHFHQHGFQIKVWWRMFKNRLLPFLQITVSGQSGGEVLGRLAPLSQSNFWSLSRSLSGLLFHRTAQSCLPVNNQRLLQSSLLMNSSDKLRRTLQLKNNTLALWNIHGFPRVSGCRFLERPLMNTAKSQSNLL